MRRTRDYVVTILATLKRDIAQYDPFNDEFNDQDSFTMEYVVEAMNLVSARVKGIELARNLDTGDPIYNHTLLTITIGEK